MTTAICAYPVRSATLEHILFLHAKGALPAAPDLHREHPKRRAASTHDLIRLRWWLAGPENAPSAYMATLAEYDYGEGRDCVRIVALGGSKISVGRLIGFALEMAKRDGARFIADIPAGAAALSKYAARLHMTPRTVRWGIDFG